MNRSAVVSLISAAFVLNVLLVSPVCGAIQFPDNGNHYDLVFTGAQLNWIEARDAAAGMQFMGASGHLVTITSAAENAFLLANFQTTGAPRLAYIGASDANAEGVWRWEVGPEAGIQFWSGGPGGRTTPPFNYANWSTNAWPEPNDAAGDEDYAWLNYGDQFAQVPPAGQWGDVNLLSGNQVVWGYFVEYEAIPEPASIVVWSLLVCVGLTVASRRQRKAA